MTKFKIAIIGGGASGLAAASELARLGVKNVAIIEKNARAGKKLLLTGNGRCNLGHIPLGLNKYHGDIDLAEAVFSDWLGAEAFFEKLGLICRKDEAGRLYPYSNTAASVLDALRLFCEDVNLICNETCAKLIPDKAGFFIIELESGKKLFAEKVIWACGDGGLKPLSNLGLEVVPLKPALCPIITDANLTKAIKGLRVNAECKLLRNGEVVKSETGEVQFGDNSLSGICVMNLSNYAEKNDIISLDLANEFTEAELIALVKKRLKLIKGDLTSEDLLTGLIPKRIGVTLIKQVGARKLDSLKLDSLEQIAKAIKDWRFPVTGFSREKAQVTAGGITGLNTDLSSKLFKNLYVIGEAVNVHGDCGGYNLEWAWASAVKAVNSIKGD